MDSGEVQLVVALRRDLIVVVAALHNERVTASHCRQRVSECGEGRARRCSAVRVRSCGGDVPRRINRWSG